MRLLLIGAPGAGKGTQAERLSTRLGIAHISSGDLLRQHVRERTSLGQTIKSYVDNGDLVPGGVVMDMLRKPVLAAAKAGGYVLDGFPRTVEQAKASFPTAHALGVEVQAAVHLDVARQEPVRRLLSGAAAQTIPQPSSRTACTCTGKRPCHCWSTTQAGNGCSPWTGPSRRAPSTRKSSRASRSSRCSPRGRDRTPCQDRDQSMPSPAPVRQVSLAPLGQPRIA